MKRFGLFIYLSLLLICLSNLSLPVFSEKISFPDYKLLPIDESNKDPNFKRFRDELVTKIKAKDFGYIITHLDENIEFSLGYPGQGIDGFIEEWKLKENPNQSKLWFELSEVIRLGFVYNKERRSFIAPYVFSKFPDSLDFYEYDVVLDKNVPLYIAPDINSKVLTKLNYNIVKFLQDIETKDKELEWAKIETASGLKGYVNGKYLRSPIDYRVEFIKVKGIWKMTFFIAGD